MSRAIVYPNAVIDKAKTVRRRPRAAGTRKKKTTAPIGRVARKTAAERENAVAEKAQGKLVDGYREKLVKYVPAEAIAFFSIAFAALKQTLEEGVWWLLLLIGGAFLTWLFASSGGDEESEVPTYYYVLAVIAFFAWAIGTTGIAGEVWGWPRGIADVVLLFAVFAIPGVDEKLTQRNMT